MSNLDMYSQLRLVSGGFQLSKTSKSDNDSGSVRSIYLRRGNRVESSIQTMVDNAEGTRYHAKAYTALDTCSAYGNPSHVMTGYYRPVTNDDVENMYSANTTRAGKDMSDQYWGANYA